MELSIAICGPSSVGKSAITIVYLSNHFPKEFSFFYSKREGEGVSLICVVLCVVCVFQKIVLVKPNTFLFFCEKNQNLKTLFSKIVLEIFPLLKTSHLCFL